jgi:DNA-3-methyladenine glycosylase
MKLDYEFFNRDAVTVAKDLVGKILVCTDENGNTKKLRITETEAYVAKLTQPAMHIKAEQNELKFCICKQEQFMFIYVMVFTGF